MGGTAAHRLPSRPQRRCDGHLRHREKEREFFSSGRARKECYTKFIALSKSTDCAMWITFEVFCVQQFPSSHSCSFLHLFMACSYPQLKKGTCDATFTSTRQLRECATLLCSSAFVRSPTIVLTRSMHAASSWACPSLH